MQLTLIPPTTLPIPSSLQTHTLSPPKTIFARSTPTAPKPPLAPTSTQPTRLPTSALAKEQQTSIFSANILPAPSSYTALARILQAHTLSLAPFESSPLETLSKIKSEKSNSNRSAKLHRDNLRLGDRSEWIREAVEEVIWDLEDEVGVVRFKDGREVAWRLEQFEGQEERDSKELRERDVKSQEFVDDEDESEVGDILVDPSPPPTFFHQPLSSDPPTSPPPKPTTIQLLTELSKSLRDAYENFTLLPTPPPPTFTSTTNSFPILTSSPSPFFPFPPTHPTSPPKSTLYNHIKFYFQNRERFLPLALIDPDKVLNGEDWEELNGLSEMDDLGLVAWLSGRRDVRLPKEWDPFVPSSSTTTNSFGEMGERDFMGEIRKLEDEEEDQSWVEKRRERKKLFDRKQEVDQNGVIQKGKKGKKENRKRLRRGKGTTELSSGEPLVSKGQLRNLRKERFEEFDFFRERRQLNNGGKDKRGNILVNKYFGDSEEEEEDEEVDELDEQDGDEDESILAKFFSLPTSSPEIAKSIHLTPLKDPTLPPSSPPPPSPPPPLHPQYQLYLALTRTRQTLLELFSSEVIQKVLKGGQHTGSYSNDEDEKKEREAYGGMMEDGDEDEEVEEDEKLEEVEMKYGYSVFVAGGAMNWSKKRAILKAAEVARIIISLMDSDPLDFESPSSPPSSPYHFSPLPSSSPPSSSTSDFEDDGISSPSKAIIHAMMGIEDEWEKEEKEREKERGLIDSLRDDFHLRIWCEKAVERARKVGAKKVSQNSLVADVQPREITPKPANLTSSGAKKKKSINCKTYEPEESTTEEEDPDFRGTSQLRRRSSIKHATRNYTSDEDENDFDATLNPLNPLAASDPHLMPRQLPKALLICGNGSGALEKIRRKIHEALNELNGFAWKASELQRFIDESKVIWRNERSFSKSAIERAKSSLRDADLDSDSMMSALLTSTKPVESGKVAEAPALSPQRRHLAKKSYKQLASELNDHETVGSVKEKKGTRTKTKKRMDVYEDETGTTRKKKKPRVAGAVGQDPAGQEAMRRSASSRQQRLFSSFTPPRNRLSDEPEEDDEDPMAPLPLPRVATPLASRHPPPSPRSPPRQLPSSAPSFQSNFQPHHHLASPLAVNNSSSFPAFLDPALFDSILAPLDDPMESQADDGLSVVEEEGETSSFGDVEMEDIDSEDEEDDSTSDIGYEESDSEPESEDEFVSDQQYPDDIQVHEPPFATTFATVLYNDNDEHPAQLSTHELEKLARPLSPKLSRELTFALSSERESSVEGLRQSASMNRTSEQDEDKEQQPLLLFAPRPSKPVMFGGVSMRGRDEW